MDSLLAMSDALARRWVDVADLGVIEKLLARHSLSIDPHVPWRSELSDIAHVNPGVALDWPEICRLDWEVR